jgi:hypothetical protein
MTKPYTRIFEFNGLRVTSLVLDKQEFDALVGEFKGLFPNMTEEMVQAMIDKQNVPMIAKGSKTAKFFSRYDILTDRMSIIVRGAGLEVLRRTINDASTS